MDILNDLIDDLSDIIKIMLGDYLVPIFSLPIIKPPNWNLVSKFYDLSHEFVKEHNNKLNWLYIAQRDIRYIKHFPNDRRKKQKFLNTHTKLDEQYMYIFKDVIDWKLLKTMQLQEDTILSCMDCIRRNRLHITYLCEKQPIYPQLIKRYADILDWVAISKRQYLTTPFITEWINRLNLDLIFHYQKLPMEIIRTYRFSIQDGHKVIPQYQELPQDVIVEYITDLDTKSVLQYQNINPETFTRIAKKIKLQKYIVQLESNKYLSIYIADNVLLITRKGERLYDALKYNTVFIHQLTE
jgi:hypothetical protein